MKKYDFYTRWGHGDMKKFVKDYAVVFRITWLQPRSNWHKAIANKIPSQIITDLSADRICAYAVEILLLLIQIRVALLLIPLDTLNVLAVDRENVGTDLIRADRRTHVN